MNEQKYTSLSEEAWKQIYKQDMTPEDAIQYFSTKFQARTFGDVLSSAMLSKGLSREMLTTRLYALRKDIQKDSLRKRVSVWLDTNGQPATREELFQLCFALSLSEEEARDFLRHSQEGDVHLRAPREAGYLYGLRVGYSYGKINNLLDCLPGIDGPFPEDKGCPKNYTQTMARTFAQIRTDVEFQNFFFENKPHFGQLHNTAYSNFMRFFNELSRPDGPCSAEPDEVYSIEKVADTYLRMGMPSGRNTSGYSSVQKAIKRLWPNATTLKNMRSRKIDVSRKVLLLLYLVTEGLDDGELEEIMGWREITPEERLEEHVWNIDLMLQECGFGTLDPRNPFDWLILYSLRSTGDEETMSDRLSLVLAALFPGREVDGK